MFVSSDRATSVVLDNETRSSWSGSVIWRQLALTGLVDALSTAGVCMPACSRILLVPAHSLPGWDRRVINGRVVYTDHINQVGVHSKSQTWLGHHE